MSLSIKGTIKHKLEVESGTSKAGKEWKAQSFVLTTEAQYNPDICFKLFGEEKIQLISNINEGEAVNVSFNLSSREYNGRWYTSAEAWKIETEDTGNLTVNDMNQEFQATGEAEDDLPF